MNNKKTMEAIPAPSNAFSDRNLFAQALRDKYCRVGGIAAEFAKEVGLNKKLVNQAFAGKPVTSSVATTLAKGLGYEVWQLFKVIKVSYRAKRKKKQSIKIILTDSASPSGKVPMTA